MNGTRQITSSGMMPISREAPIFDSSGLISRSVESARLRLRAKALTLDILEELSNLPAKSIAADRMMAAETRASGITTKAPSAPPSRQTR